MTHLHPYLKRLLSALLVLLTITACEQEPIYHSTTQVTTLEDSQTPAAVYATHNMVSLKDVPLVTQAFYNALNVSKTNTTALGPFIYELSHRNGTKTYSTLLRLKTTNAHTFYNIAVQQTSDQILGTPVIIAYQTQVPTAQIHVDNLNQTGWEITYHYNTTQFIRTNPVVGVTSQTLAFKNGTMGKTDPDLCVDSTSLIIPSDDFEFILYTNPGGSGGITANPNLPGGGISNPTGGLGNLGGSGSSSTRTTVEICMTVVETTNYSCNGPNANTPHPPGPNSGDDGDDSCGDASTGYGGSGSKGVTIQACVTIAVSAMAALPEYNQNPLEEGLISISNGNDPCEIAEMRDMLNARKDKLNAMQLSVLEALNAELESFGSIPCLNILKSNDTITLPTLGKSGLNAAKTPKKAFCPEPVDATIMLPLSTYDLLNLLNTLSLNYNGLTEAQKAWVLDPDNQLEVDNIIAFLDEHGETEENKIFAKAAIEALRTGGEVDFEEERINGIKLDSSLPPCLESMILDLMLGNFPYSDSMGNIELIENTFQSIGGTHSPSGIKIIINFKKGDISGNGKTEPKGYNSLTKTINIDITISENLIKNGTKLALIKTILHESIHANLLKIKQQYPFYFNSSNEFEQLILDYQNYTNDNDPQHIYMAEIVTDMASSISNFVQEKYGYPPSTINYYEAVCWSGLTHLADGNLNPLFTDNYPNFSDQENIIKIFNTENGTEIHSGYTPLIKNNCN